MICIPTPTAVLFPLSHLHKRSRHDSFSSVWLDSSFYSPLLSTHYRPKVVFIFSYWIYLFIWLISLIRIKLKNKQTKNKTKKPHLYSFYLQQSEMYICRLIDTLTQSARDTGARILPSMTSKNDIPVGEKEAWLVWKTCLGRHIQWRPEWNHSMSLNKWKIKTSTSSLDSFLQVCSLECEIKTTSFFFFPSAYSSYFLLPCLLSFSPFISHIFSHVLSAFFLPTSHDHSKLGA